MATRATQATQNRAELLRPSLIALLVWQLAHMIMVFSTGAMRMSPDLSALVDIGKCVASVLAPFAAAWLMLRSRPLLLGAVATVLVALHALLNGYLYATKWSVDFAVIADNLHEAFEPESFELMADVFSHKYAVGSEVAGALLLAWLIWRHRRAQPVTGRDRAMAGGVMALWLAVVAGTDTHQDELASLVHAALAPRFDSELEAAHPLGTFPLVHSERDHGAPGPSTAQPGSRWRAADQPLPNVIIVAIESFNATVIGRQTPDGKAVAPVFEKLASRGLWVDRFYANSVQTSKGHFSILFGTQPMIRGKALRRAHEQPYKSLPSRLVEAGYQTAFVQGYRSLDFDNTRRAMLANGFGVCTSIHDRLQPEDKPFVWGWGPEDKVFYKHALAVLDELHDKQPDKPVFATLATIANHMRFKVPERRRKLFAEPKSLAERYMNSAHLCDAQLEDLLRELRSRPWLKDTVLVITGDHSFPIGAHGFEHNELGYFDESFRTPMLLLWSGHVRPKRERERVASHIDIAPTLLHLLGIPTGKHHFEGRSMLGAEPSVAPLVQPYNGTWLGVVDGRYKYLQRQRTGEERVYDLIADPGETRNVIAAAKEDGRALRYRERVERMKLTSWLVEQGRVWPLAKGHP